MFAVETMRCLLLFLAAVEALTENIAEEPIPPPYDFKSEAAAIGVTADLGYMTHEYNKYYLYTRNNPSVPQQLLFGNQNVLDSSFYSPTKVTVILCHGWYGDGFGSFSETVKEAFLEDDDVNVIVVDWSPRSLQDYVTAKLAVAIVGRVIGLFINWLASVGTPYIKIHCVGFSLGAHAMGIAGRTTGSQIGRITGLDPAGPLWDCDLDRISKTDAAYVEIIHTNIHDYGISQPCGDADFYVNGGDIQPGCTLPSCSHSRSYQFFASTLKSKGLRDNMIAKKCETFFEATLLWEICTGDDYVMGTSDLTKSGSGLFRISTLDAEPFL